MSPKSGLLLLFWLQNTFAQNLFFGQDSDLPLSSNLKSSPLVHFSQHSGKQGQRIDIVSWMNLSTQFHNFTSNQNHQSPITMKDWVSLFADYITPNGPGVNQTCIDAGKLYIKQLNQVTSIPFMLFSINEMVYFFMLC